MDPTAKVDPRYTVVGADAIDWAEGLEILKEAPVSWVSTVRPDGRPHVTPLITVYLEPASTSGRRRTSSATPTAC